LSLFNDDYGFVWTVSIDGRQQNEVVKEEWEIYSARWSRLGDVIYYLVYQDQTTDIRKITVSADTGKPLGKPVPILEGHQIGTYITLANDGKHLCYTREIYSSNVWLASRKGSGKSQKVDVKPLTTGTQITMAPTFSPDGKFIAYGRGNYPMEIFVVPAEGGPSQQITFMDSWSGGPAWSPDGKEIAFASNQDGAPRIWKISAAGGTPQVLAKTDGTWPSWAPGPKILFQTYSGMHLMACDPEKGDVTELLKTDSEWEWFYPTWSPDRKRIAIRLEKGPETEAGIFILPSDGSARRMIRKGRAVPINWSSDGNILYASEPASGGINILSISPENGQEEVLFTIPLSREIGRLKLRPHTVDGRRFVFEGRKIQSDVWLMENFDPEVK
jgi:Tol biopolymer transport system component